MGEFDRVTLFRILNLFEEKNIIHSIRIDSENNFYSICYENCGKEGHFHDHVHFKCESCNDVSCLSIDEFPSISIPNYKINNIDINIVEYVKHVTHKKNNMYKIIIFLFFLSPIVSSQNNAIVTDNNKNPLSDVDIYFSDLELMLKSDKNGLFIIPENISKKYNRIL